MKTSQFFFCREVVKACGYICRRLGIPPIRGSYGCSRRKRSVFLVPGSKDAGKGLYVYLGFALGWTDSV